MLTFALNLRVDAPLWQVPSLTHNTTRCSTMAPNYLERLERYPEVLEMIWVGARPRDSTGAEYLARLKI